MLALGLIDEYIIYLSTSILGDQGRGLFSLPGLQYLADKKTLHLQDVRQIGQDLKLTLTA